MTGGRPSIVFTRKAVVDEAFIGNSTIICKSILELMQANLILSQCVKMPEDCLRGGSLTLICGNSRLDIIELATLRIWSCIFTRKQDQNVKLRVFLHLVNRKTRLF